MAAFGSRLLEFILLALLNKTYCNMYWIDERNRVFIINAVHKKSKQFSPEYKCVFEDYARVRGLKTDPQTVLFNALRKSSYFVRIGKTRKYQFSEKVEYSVDGTIITVKILYKGNKWRTFKYDLNANLTNVETFSCSNSPDSNTFSSGNELANGDLITEGAPMTPAIEDPANEINIDVNDWTVPENMDLSPYLSDADENLYMNMDNIFREMEIDCQNSDVQKQTVLVDATCSSEVTEQLEYSEPQSANDQTDLTVCGDPNETSHVNAQYLEYLSASTGCTETVPSGIGTMQVLGTIVIMELNNEQHAVLVPPGTMV